ncbi:TetR family transcriptional regulator [Rhodovulum bhavnagarense]|uniref:TetR family transcriptional regulator n=1 Tax=Rhodovulum bhavnagarense TaxID=992286 RepID=A0A4R2RP29_9RHOB|nr:TetR/AcrR family transcriptional regulator [Rhodovulum bhavnagarense]TCP60945.1 TetR family transcriptional regulator [Rhodovulum bhavnagarense]
MNAPTDKIKRGRKFDQVLDGAREVFLRDGFEGASVDEIARAAGVSKATLYSYFPDKRLLFMEVFRLECDRQTGAAMNEIDFCAPIAEVLRQAARHMVLSFLAPFNQAVFRICVAEADRFPDLGAAYYDSGPLRLRHEIVAHLDQARARRELAIDDLDLAADQFIELCKTDLYTRCVFGVDHRFGEAEIERVVEGAVTMFLARYGG